MTGKGDIRRAEGGKSREINGRKGRKRGERGEGSPLTKILNTLCHQKVAQRIQNFEIIENMIFSRTPLKAQDSQGEQILEKGPS